MESENNNKLSISDRITDLISYNQKTTIAIAMAIAFTVNTLVIRKALNKVRENNKNQIEEIITPKEVSKDLFELK